MRSHCLIQVKSTTNLNSSLMLSPGPRSVITLDPQLPPSPDQSLSLCPGLLVMIRFQANQSLRNQLNQYNYPHNYHKVAQL